jgi:succinoglycan biosynthesis transport protein ExoP
MIATTAETNEQHFDDLDSNAGGSTLPSLFSIVGIAWRRKSLVALGAVVGLVIGSLYYAQCAPIYESASQVLLVKKRPEAITGDNGHVSHFEDYVNTHRTLIQSPLIVERAVNQGSLAGLSSFEGEERQLTQAVIANLSVNRVSKSDGLGAESILGLSFRGKVAEECGVVVNAILDSYKQFLGETYRDMSEDTVTLITEARDLLQKNLVAQEIAYREFRQTSPLIWKGTENVNPRQDRLAMIESQRSTLLLRKTELQANLATIEAATQAGRGAEEVIALASNLANKAEYSTTQEGERVTLHSQLLPLLIEEQSILQDLGPNHPHVQSVRKQIEATRKFFALPSATYGKLAERPAASGTQAESTEELVQLYIQYLKEELAHLNTSDKLLAEIYESEHEAARKMAGYEIRDEEFRRGIERTQALYDGIIKQLQDVAMVKDYGGFEARVIAPAGIGRKVVPNAMTVFPASGLLGVLFGLGLVYLAELMDKSFRTPEEISRQLGLRVVGHIPLFDVDPKIGATVGSNGHALHPVLCTYHQSRSAESEAYRGLRTALYFNSTSEGCRVIQITSPNPGDGKTTLVANIAISMAQSGKKVLLIDADLRKPRLHQLFGTSGEIGLASVIAEEMEFQEAIQECGIANLWLLPCGSVPPDPAELLTSPRFCELIAAVRDQYDYVLVDSAPLLAVTDPCVVAARVDGVLLTIRIAQDGRQHAQRAKAILSTMGVNILGVVVNAVPRGDGSYGYGSGYYGYKQNGYGYIEDYHDEAGNGQPAPVRRELVQR